MFNKFFIFIIVSIALVMFTRFGITIPFGGTGKENNHYEVTEAENILAFFLTQDTVVCDSKKIDMPEFERKVSEATRQGRKIHFTYDASVTVGFAEKLKNVLKRMKATYYGLE